MSRLFSGSSKEFLNNVKFMLRYAVQCRLRRQQYKDSLEMQVEKAAATLASKNHDHLFHDQEDEGADEHVVPPGARLARAVEEVRG